MSDEITTNDSLRFRKGDIDVEFPDFGSFTADVAGDDYHLGTQTVSATPAALNKGNVSTPGYMVIKNMSSTSNEIVRLKTSVSGVNFAKILPGERAKFQWDENLTAPYVLADTGTPKIQYLLIEA